MGSVTSSAVTRPSFSAIVLETLGIMVPESRPTRIVIEYEALGELMINLPEKSDEYLSY
jgi:hypothetical protein